MKELKAASSETEGGERNITNGTTTHKVLFVIINPSVTTIVTKLCQKLLSDIRSIWTHVSTSI